MSREELCELLAEQATREMVAEAKEAAAKGGISRTDAMLGVIASRVAVLLATAAVAPPEDMTGKCEPDDKCHDSACEHCGPGECFPFGEEQGR